MKNFKFLPLFLIWMNLNGQQSFSLYPLKSIPQSSLMNPARPPDSKWHIGIPALNSNYFQYSNGGFSLNEIFNATESNGDSLTLNLNKVLNILSKKNYISLKTEVSLLSGGFKFQKHYFHFSVTEKVHTGISLPKDLFRFIIDGNGGDNLGETFEFAFKASAMHYREHGIGYSYTIDDKLSLGARLKVLQGFSTVNTKRAQINVTTNKESFNYLIQSNIELNTASNFVKIIDTSTNGNEQEFDFKSQLLGSKNRGLGLDLGVNYKVNDDLEVSASIVDMGFIKWKTNAVSIKSRNPEAKYEFDGIHIHGTDSSTDFGQYMKDVADSLLRVFRLDTAHGGFTTSLSTEFYISAMYNLSGNKVCLGGMIYGDFFNRRFYPGLTLNLMLKPHPRLTLNFTNTFYNGGYINPGMAGSLNLGAFQMYAAMDNFLFPFAFASFKSFGIRAGMNLTFNREGGNSYKKRRKSNPEEAIPDSTTPVD